MSEMSVEEAVSLTNQEWSTNPQLKKNKNEVLEKYGKIFKLENIDNLTVEDFQKFLTYGEITIGIIFKETRQS
jgi:hypothetical protein